MKPSSILPGMVPSVAAGFRLWNATMPPDTTPLSVSMSLNASRCTPVVITATGIPSSARVPDTAAIPLTLWPVSNSWFRSTPSPDWTSMRRVDPAALPEAPEGGVQKLVAWEPSGVSP
jgi:hypothetical protein